MAGKEQQKKISRRKFGRNTLIGTLAAGSLASWWAYDQPWHVPYQFFYDLHLSGQRGSEFTHPEFRTEYVVSNEEKAEFERAFSQHRRNFVIIKLSQTPSHNSSQAHSLHLQVVCL